MGNIWEVPKGSRKKLKRRCKRGSYKKKVNARKESLRFDGNLANHFRQSEASKSTNKKQETNLFSEKLTSLSIFPVNQNKFKPGPKSSLMSDRIPPVTISPINGNARMNVKPNFDEFYQNDFLWEDENENNQWPKLDPETGKLYDSNGVEVDFGGPRSPDSVEILDSQSSSRTNFNKAQPLSEDFNMNEEDTEEIEILKEIKTESKGNFSIQQAIRSNLFSKLPHPLGFSTNEVMPDINSNVQNERHFFALYNAERLPIGLKITFDTEYFQTLNAEQIAVLSDTGKFGLVQIRPGDFDAMNSLGVFMIQHYSSQMYLQRCSNM